MPSKLIQAKCLTCGREFATHDSRVVYCGECYTDMEAQEDEEQEGWDEI